MNYIIITLLIIILIIINLEYITEKFSNYYTIPMYLDHTNLPWWNSKRTTRNMSYDLRGDPLTIIPQQFIWNNSNLF